MRVRACVCVCVLIALVIQHVKVMRRIIWSYVIWLYDIFFLHYLTSGTIFGKELLNIKCVFWFCLKLLSETFLSLTRIKRDIIVFV